MRIKTKLHKQLLFWASLWFAQFCTFYLLTKSNNAIKLFIDFYEWQKKEHQQLFSQLNFSVGDIFYTVLFLYIIYLFYQIIIKNNKHQWITIFILLNVLYFSYQTFWGMMYYQNPIVVVTKNKKIPVEKLKLLAEKYLQLCINDRNNTNEDSKGIFKIKNLNTIEKQLIIAQNDIPKNYNNKKSTHIVNSKKSLFDPILSYTGIAGYYNPFTSEAQYDKNLPDSSKILTLAHELAHQLGYAREQEASFIGFLSITNSENPELRYSANLYALKNILSNINQSDPKWVEKTLNNYSKGMKRDRYHEKLFQKNYESPLSTFFALTNDIFLKSNKQDGTISYNYFIYLLLEYEQ